MSDLKDSKDKKENEGYYRGAGIVSTTSKYAGYDPEYGATWIYAGSDNSRLAIFKHAYGELAAKEMEDIWTKRFPNQDFRHPQDYAQLNQIWNSMHTVPFYFVSRAIDAWRENNPSKSTPSMMELDTFAKTTEYQKLSQGWEQDRQKMMKQYKEYDQRNADIDKDQINNRSQEWMPSQTSQTPASIRQASATRRPPESEGPPATHSKPR